MANSTTEFAKNIENGQSEGNYPVPGSVICRKAFITAPYTTDTSLLRQALQDRGFVAFELDELPSLGRSIPELLEDSLKEADLVIAVAGSPDEDNRSAPRGVGFTHNETQFCLGYAAALKKKILVLVPTNGRTLFGLPCLFFDPSHATRETIDHWLDLILGRPPKLSPRFTDDITNLTHPLGSKADEFLVKVRSREELNLEGLKAIARNVFESCGISSVFTSPGMITPGRPEVDMTVFSDDFVPWVGTPLPIEFDVASRSSAELEGHQEGLARWIDQIHLPWGLLIHRNPVHLSKEQAFRHPEIFVISLEGFIESLRTTSPGDFFRLWRNRRVRGIA